MANNQVILSIEPASLQELREVALVAKMNECDQAVKDIRAFMAAASERINALQAEARQAEIARRGADFPPTQHLGRKD